MTDSYTDLPDGWEGIDTEYDFQKHAFSEQATGERLLVEEKIEPWHDEDEPPDYYVTLVSGNSDEPEPIRTVMEQAKDPEVALDEAYQFMLRRARR